MTAFRTLVSDFRRPLWVGYCDEWLKEAKSSLGNQTQAEKGGEDAFH